MACESGEITDFLRYYIDKVVIDESHFLRRINTMNKNLIFICSLAAILLLAACSPVQFSEYTGTQANSSSIISNDTPSAYQTIDPMQGNNGLSTEIKLLIGTIQLEGTKNEVTPDQAKELFPLWVKMEATMANMVSTADDINAITTQIQLIMTKEQLKAINDMNLTVQDLIALMQKLNISFGYDNDDDSTLNGTDVPQSSTPGLIPDITPTVNATPSNQNGTPQIASGSGQDRRPYMIPSELLNVLIKYLQARESPTS
jgi:hypothetical protein